MDFLWDTNILLHQIRQSPQFEIWNQQHNFFDDSNRNFISIVTVGEIYSLALKRNWGNRKLEQLQIHLNSLHTLPIAKRSIINAYARLDAFSQGKLSDNPLPKGLTARNMGKNDLWIAATTSSINATLVTTDKDFEHFDEVFLRVLNIHNLSNDF